MTRRIVEDAINLSLTRRGVERLDLLQFHWWDYENDGYLNALKHLSDLQQEGMIRHLALTNFDTERLRVIADHGVRIVSNQVQYSLIDRRPDVRMARFCSEHAVTLLAAGCPIERADRRRRYCLSLTREFHPAVPGGCPTPGARWPSWPRPTRHRDPHG